MSRLTTDFSPALSDLYVVAGATFKKVFTLEYDSEPLDLTGWEIIGFISDYFSVERRFSFETDLYSDSILGKIEVSLSAETTSRMNKPRYVYSIFAMKDEEVVKLSGGQVLVELS